MLAKKNPSKTKSWKELADHYETMKNVHIKDLFADDPGRFEKFSIRFNDILVDYSKNRITPKTLKLLIALTNEIGLLTLGGKVRDFGTTLGCATDYVSRVSRGSLVQVAEAIA